MFEQQEITFYRFRFLTGGLFAVVTSLLLIFVVSGILAGGTAQAAPSTPVTSYDSPNVVTNGFLMAKDSAAQSVRSSARTINGSLRSAGTSALHQTASAASGAAKGGVMVTQTVFTTAATVASGSLDVAGSAAKLAGKGLIFPIRTGAHVALAVSNFSFGGFITPAENTAKPAPVINAVSTPGQSPPAPAPIPTAAPLNPSPAPADSTAAWPIHGAITTEFGVPHWPFQPTHTGLDISDGAAPGVTPVHPFKPGKVISVIHSSTGFGNNVIIDHGAGVTSLYGHMYSTAVQVGQEVTKDTVLGLEGSTGASTGTHLHFEVRLNGQPVDPRRYVSGHP